MNQDILLTKIVPNSTDTTWSQAYTTLNVYITLSIEKQDATSPVNSYGKELLEKLQREFFALDDKSLENIKKAVANVSNTIDEKYNFSILVGAIVEDVLYIVIASVGQVIIKRDGQIAVIAKGGEKELHGFSGKLKHDDIIIFETGDFEQKIPLQSLQEYLTSHDVMQIAENVTPIIHDNSKGTESAIILQYKDLSKMHETSENREEVSFAKHGEAETIGKHEEEVQNIEEPAITIPAHEENLWTKQPVQANHALEDMEEEIEEEQDKSQGKNFFSNLTSLIPSFNLKGSNAGNKKTIIITAVIILVVLLVGSIVFENFRKEAQKRETAFNNVYNPAQQKLDEGASLASLNKSQALDTLNTAQKQVNDALPSFPNNSVEKTKLNALLARIADKIKEIGGGSSAKNVKELLTTNNDLKSIDAVTIKGGDLVVSSITSKKAATISTDGKVKKTFDTKDIDPKYLASDDKFIYVMDGSIVKIDKGNGKADVVVKDVKASAVDVFGGNIYALNGKDIDKYKTPSYTSASYFTETPSFASNPTDITISGSIFVLSQDGSIQKFTKGKKDTFEVKGLLAPFGQGARIYTDEDFTNVYIMDVKNQRVVVLSTKGEYQNQYEGSFISNANSFAIDEKNKIGFVLSGNKLYSFDL